VSKLAECSSETPTAWTPLLLWLPKWRNRPLANWGFALVLSRPFVINLVLKSLKASCVSLVRGADDSRGFCEAVSHAQRSSIKVYAWPATATHIANRALSELADQFGEFWNTGIPGHRRVHIDAFAYDEVGYAGVAALTDGFKGPGLAPLASVMAWKLRDAGTIASTDLGVTGRCESVRVCGSVLLIPAILHVNWYGCSRAAI
jgi:hypothetical protein